MLILHRTHQAKKGSRKGEDIIVECLIKDGSKMAGAITICDPRDKFDLKFGMDQSFKLAMHELKGRKDKNHTLPVVNDKTKLTIRQCGLSVPRRKARLMNKTLTSKACRLEQKFLDV